MAIIGMIAGISYPAVTAGLESIRLASAADALASFLNGALNRAERRQQVVELLVSPKDNLVVLHSTEPGFERKLNLPDGITIEAVLPALSDEQAGMPRRILFLPGGTAPRIGVQIANRKGGRRIVRVDPMTGIPRIETVEAR